MAKHKRKKKQTSVQTADSKELKRHMRTIGVQSVSDYQSWCRNRGLGAGLKKSANQLDKERAVSKNQQADAVLSRNRRYTRSPKNTIVQLYRRQIQKERLGVDYLKKIRTLFGQFEDDTRSRRALLDLLLQVEHADLFGMEPAIARFGQRPGNTFIDGLGALARHHSDWLQPVEAWQPASHNPRKQFSSLGRHLLAQYEVPTFMDAAWFQEGAPQAADQQGWFKHLGAGHNIRTAEVPVRLSKMMAHHFLLAPDDLTIDHALRWGQVVGQGGCEALARAVIVTRLGNSFESEDFWASVILFLVNNPMLDPACVGPIVDFIHNQKYEPREIVLPGGAIERTAPPQPNFSMKSRSVAKLLRQMEEWHEELAREIFDEGDNSAGKKGRQRLTQWERSGVGEFNLTEEHKSRGEKLHWSIKELMSNRDLVAEGRDMHHCVASYAKNCRRGNTSIWSLQVTDGQRQRHAVLTVALDVHTRTITQVRGKYNMSISGKARDKNQQKLNNAYRRYLERGHIMMRRWMEREGLVMGC